MGQSEKLDAALLYAALGWFVVPNCAPDGEGRCQHHEACEHIGKVPLVRGWGSKATDDATSIREWWAKYPDANVGIATGRHLNIVVLDVDGASGMETLRKLERIHGVLPETVTFVTGGGGRHYVFRHPGGRVKNAVRLWPGIDIRGDGGQIIVPPSLHVSGREYVPDLGKGPREVLVTALPEWLNGPIASRSRQSTADIDDTRPQKLTKRLELMALVLSGVEKGHRHSTLFAFICSLRARGAKRDLVEDLALCSAAKCTPPYPKRRALAIVADVWQRYPEGGGRG